MGRPRPAYDTQVLSSPFEYMESQYDTIVVGSGYGGAIAAARLAEAGTEVCILERGRELHPGEYPSRLAEAAASFQVRLGRLRIGSRSALFDFRFGNGVSALVGAGLGGTSLINANVCIEPVEQVWDDPSWPEELRKARNEVDDGMDLARGVLGAKPLPHPLRGKLLKVEALKAEAKALKAHFDYPPLAVTFAAGPNEVGVEQGECRLCGDCCSGCNYGAKNTTLMNYLPLARSHGASIFTEVEVDSVEPVKGENGEIEWLVHFDRVRWGQRVYRAPKRFVRARRVVLAAGALGSTAILLRSVKSRGLRTSVTLGQRFSGNGDVLAFAYNGTNAVNGVGLGERHPDEQPPVGPTIAGMIRHEVEVLEEDGTTVKRSMVIEEGSGPGAASRIIAALLLFRSFLSLNFASPEARKDRARWRRLLNLPFEAYRGAVHHTQTHLVMTEDAAAGTLSLDRGGDVKIEYGGVSAEPVFAAVDEALRRASESIGATHIRSPLSSSVGWETVRSAWRRLRASLMPPARLRSDLVTVHPLGGCAMADDCEQGVVDHLHRVFDGASADSTYESLLVMDGAVVPRSLGANPLLTISGLAERASKHLVGRLKSATVAAKRAPAQRVDTLGLGFTESLVGPIRFEVDADGNPLAERKTCEMTIVLDMEIDDIEQFVNDPKRRIGSSGVVQCEFLFGSEPGMITAKAVAGDARSTANILTDDESRPNQRIMTYELHVVDRQGRCFHISGLKVVRDHLLRAWRIWPETTEMQTRVFLVEKDAKRFMGEGLTQVTFGGLLKQIITQRGLHVRTWRETLVARLIFLRWFMPVVTAHGSPLLAPPRYVPPKQRKVRPLEAPVGEPVELLTGDGVKLRITRYNDGSEGKPPVLLAHGLGVSSRIFTTTTIRQNLVEYLVERGYDVWALDNRVSIDLPELCKQPISGDDIARWDYSAALDVILRMTKAKQVNVFAHCFGATTFLMAVLGGWVDPAKVRALVTSQVGTHLFTTWPTRLKAGLHAEYWLEGSGVDNLSAYTDPHVPRMSRLYNRALRFLPVGRGEVCRSGVCHRITALYSLLYRHENLTRETHDALDEMFGTVNLRAIRHLAEISRQGKLVDFEGGDRYLPHMENLKFPFRMIHGAENFCFTPEGTRLTEDLLRREKQARPAVMGGPYDRRVIPGYGHIDCIFGRDASRDVYPLVSEVFS